MEDTPIRADEAPRLRAILRFPFDLVAAASRRRRVDAAVVRVHRWFAKRHPELAASLFDLHLMTHGARHLVLEVAAGAEVDARAFAEAWADQWAFSPSSAARHVAQSMPCIQEFTAALVDEIGSGAAKRPAAFDRVGQRVTLDARPIAPLRSQRQRG